MKQDETLTTKTLAGLFWMFSGKGSQAILQFIVMVFLARLLSPSDFGVVNAATIIITFTTVFSMVGVGPALIQQAELTEAHVRTGFTITILLSILFASVLFFGSDVIASFFRMDKLKLVLKFMCLIFLLKGLSIVSESLLQRQLKFRVFASIEVVSYTVYGVIGVGCAIFGLDYWSLVYAQISQNLVKTFLLISAERHNMKPLFQLEAAKELLFFGGGFTIARLSNQFALQADNLVVGRWLGASALGFYGRAYQLMIMPTNLFGQVMDKVLFPAMAKIQESQDKLTRSFRVGITAIAFFTIPVGILMCLLSKEIVLLLFGKKWLDLVPALQVLSLGLVFRTGYKISDSLARATGAVYRRAWRQIIYAIAVFLGAWLGHFGGIFGVSIGVLGAIMLNYSLMTNLSMKFVNLTFLEIIKAHIPGVVLGVFALVSGILAKWITTKIVLPSIVIIILTGLIFLILIAMLTKLNAEKFLGKDVIWIKNQVLSMVKDKLKKSA